MTFNIDDVMEVLQLVRECKDTELYIDTGEMKLSITKGKVSGGGRGFMGPGGGAPADAVAAPALSAAAAEPAAQVQAAAAAPPAAVAAAAESEAGLVPLTANVTSVFYRRPSPEEPPFVEVGDLVQEDTVVCLLEVMKCFRQVMAETRGRVAKICVESSHLVEEGTVMFLIRPE